MHFFDKLVCVPDRRVWVSDSQQPFVDQGMNPHVLYMREKHPLIIPCRVTHPNVTTTLVKVSTESMNKSDSRDVFPSAVHPGFYSCHTLSFSPQSHTHIITCPSFFHQGSYMHTMHHTVVSPSPDHSLHCSYLGSHYHVACVSVCLCPSADMCESVCGYVCECLVLEC